MWATRSVASQTNRPAYRRNWEGLLQGDPFIPAYQPSCDVRRFKLRLGERALTQHIKIVRRVFGASRRGGRIELADLKNTAAPQAAGYILQLDRALYHLAKADHDAAVAVEHVDDVVVLRAGRPTLQEQDKNSLRDGAEILGDRSKALWRTLQIWLEHRTDAELARCEKYFLVSNQPAKAKIARLIKARMLGKASGIDVVAALRLAGKSKSKSKVQSIIDDVLRREDADLIALIERVEIVDGFDADAARVQIANGFAIDPKADVDDLLDSLFGWLTRTLRQAWALDQPGAVTREACIRQCRELERRQARRRFLPRPAREVPVAALDHSDAMARPFVVHLGRIEAESDDVLQAVEWPAPAG